MIELILAGVIIGAVMTTAVVTGVWDRQRRKAERAASAPVAPRGEPIPSGWAATGGSRSGTGGHDDDNG
jgi:hypothetical protein